MAEVNTGVAVMEEIPDRFELTTTEAEDTGLRLFQLTDSKTGIIGTFVEFNENYDVHAAVAWVGARTSRANTDTVEIFRQVVQADNAGEKLVEVWGDYGHASVADMGYSALVFDDIPMEVAHWLFNKTSVGQGQEKSTRYVGWDKDSPLTGPTRGLIDQLPQFDDPETAEQFETRWTELHAEMLGNYADWHETLKGRLSDWLTGHGYDVDERSVSSTINSRSLDVARLWLPFSEKTRYFYNTSIRNWIDIAAQARESDIPGVREIGDHIVELLRLSSRDDLDIQAELSDLTKYDEGSGRVRSNTQEVERLVRENTSLNDLAVRETEAQLEPTEQVVDILDTREFKSRFHEVLFQYVTGIFPGLQHDTLVDALNGLSDEELEQFGSAIFDGHTNHDLMRGASDVRGPIAVFEAAYSIIRDLNRQRAFGRFAVSLETESFVDVVLQGPVKSIAMNTAEYWADLVDDFENQFAAWYDKYYELISDVEDALEGAEYNESVWLQMLPLGHKGKFLMSGPINQHLYMLYMRIKAGGDYEYRYLLHQLLKQDREIAGLSSMAAGVQEPDINNPEDVLGRS